MANKYKILLVGSSPENFDSNDISFVTLPHPKYGPMVFLMSRGRHFELQKSQPRKFGSWFINQRVLSDSSYLIASKFDIKYLLLPFFEKSEKYCPLDQIISYTEGCDRINLTNSAEWGLGNICDINDKLGDDMILYRLNQEKVLSWLRRKVSNAAEVICKQRRQRDADSLQSQTFNSSAQSKSAILTTNTDGSVSEEDRRTALTIIADYLSDNMTEKLLETYGMSMDSILPSKSSTAASSSNRKSDWERALEVEKETMPYAAAHTTQGPTNPSADNVATKRKAPASTSNSAKASKLAKPAGVKSITSFFAKK